MKSNAEDGTQHIAKEITMNGMLEYFTEIIPVKDNNMYRMYKSLIHKYSLGLLALVSSGILGSATTVLLSFIEGTFYKYSIQFLVFLQFFALCAAIFYRWKKPEQTYSILVFFYLFMIMLIAGLSFCIRTVCNEYNRNNIYYDWKNDFI